MISNETLKEKLNIISKIAQDKKIEVYIVGGFLRDLFLEQTSPDIDLLVIGDAYRIGEESAARTKSSFIILDNKEKLYRLADKNDKTHIDLGTAQENNLLKDLKRRDYTINALAMPLEKYLSGEKTTENITDPFNGLKDLKEKTLKPVHKNSLKNDPLRILRGVRLSLGKEFKLPTETIMSMVENAPYLKKVSKERIKEELWRIFYLPNSYKAIEIFYYEIKALPYILPQSREMETTEQNYHHSTDVWLHGLLALKELESIIANKTWPLKYDKEICNYITEKLTALDTKLPTLKFTALFHDIGKIKTYKMQKDGRITFHKHQQQARLENKLGRQLKMGKKESFYLSSLIRRHMDPLYFFSAGEPSQKAKNKLFNRCQKDIPGILLLSLADKTATYKAAGKDKETKKYQEFIFKLFGEYYKREINLAKPSLLDGHDIMKLYNLPPGLKVGEMLDALESAQAEGIVNTRQDAEAYLKDETCQNLKKNCKKS